MKKEIIFCENCGITLDWRIRFLKAYEVFKDGYYCNVCAFAKQKKMAENVKITKQNAKNK